MINRFVTQSPYPRIEDQCDGRDSKQEIRLGAHTDGARKRCRLDREAQGHAAGFRAKQTAANNAFTNAWSARIDGTGTIIGQIALDRVIAEGKAKSAANAEAAKLATDIDSSKADIQDSMFSASSSGQLDSGTKIDLDAGTITLSDGTVIDAKTGAKKINITV